MHSTDLASSLKSHFCSSYLHCARFWIGQTLFFLSTVINTHLCSYLFVICISQILFAFSTHQFCKLEFYFSVFMHCIALPLTLNSHYCASGFFCFSFANLALALNSHYCLSKLHSTIFMHFTGLPLTLDSHYRTFEFYSAVFFIARTLLSLSAVINAHPSFILLVFALHRPCSYPQMSILQIGALFCCLYTLHKSCCVSKE